MIEPLHIQVYAATTNRRARIAEMVRRSVERASIACTGRLSPAAAGDAPPDVWIADLEAPASAEAFLNALESESWPGDFGKVALIDDPDPPWVRAAIEAGVGAIISRQPDRDELRLAIEAAEAGLILLHPSSAQELITGNLLAAEADLTLTEHLTPREREVLLLIADGLGNKQIAARLGISDHTAKFHISSILGKLNVTSRTEAVSQGIRRGLIPI